MNEPARRAGTALMIAALSLAGCAAAPPAGPTTVQAGAPGAPSRVVAPAEVAGSPARHSPDDVRFMQHMIVHHAQAVLMSGMVEERTGNESIRLLARRIADSQEDEMQLMRRWLSVRGEPLEDLHAAHGHVAMPGMLGEQQLARLAAATGAAFDRLFVELMIEHHQGALAMVQELFATERGGRDVEIFDFASHVDADQRMEIERMRRLLATM